MTLTDDNLRSLTPCEVVRVALPAALANQLLKILLADSASWTRGTWYMGGKEHLAPRTSAYYSLQERQVPAFEHDNSMSNCVAGPSYHSLSQKSIFSHET